MQINLGARVRVHELLTMLMQNVARANVLCGRSLRQQGRRDP